MSDRHLDGSAWEASAGYARAARRGRRIAVSGTTASDSDGNALFPRDTYAQTLDAIDRGLRAIEKLGGTREDILRTRIYLVEGADWEEASAAHAERFAETRPANTLLFVQGLVGIGCLVEVELEAEVGS